MPGEPALDDAHRRPEGASDDLVEAVGKVSEALEAVEAFLVASQTRGLRQVLLVHGKGQNSPQGVPVLKRALARALTHKRLAKRVLAFCTARPLDGGTGALYVLLRRWQGPGRPRW